MGVTHPRFEYLLVACVAAVVTYLCTPIARNLAVRWRALALPRDRDVHAVAIPRLGGTAMFVGLALSLLVATKLPTLRASFNAGPDMPWVLAAGAIICGVGILDDKFELDSLTKLAGQVLATGLMVTQGGVQLAYLPNPFGGGTITFDHNLGIPLTILLTLLTINAMNFIDGLDGLAAGVTVVAAGAFFVFAFHLAQAGELASATTPTLLAAALAGVCIGFLPHNFFPARIFMGDSGSMLVGLMLSAAAVTATTTADPQAFSSSTFGPLPLYLPLLIPVAVLALPFVDLVLAVVRRVRKGRSPFAPDKQHLHHRLLEIGHSHRRAVLLLYFWSALVAAAGVGLSFPERQGVVLGTLAVLAVFGLLASIVPRRRRPPKAPASAPAPATAAPSARAPGPSGGRRRPEPAQPGAGAPLSDR